MRDARMVYIVAYIVLVYIIRAEELSRVQSLSIARAFGIFVLFRSRIKSREIIRLKTLRGHTRCSGNSHSCSV